MEEQIDLYEILHKIKGIARRISAHKGAILSLATINLAIATGVILKSPEEFESQVRLIMNDRGAGAMRLPGLAALSIQGTANRANDNAITPDLYPTLASTLDFKIAVAETPLYFVSRKKKLSGIQFFSESTKESSQIIFAEELIKHQDDYLGTVNRIAERFSVTIEENGAILRVTGRMPDRTAAADLAQKTAKILTNKIAEIESRKARAYFNFMQSQQIAAKEAYERKQVEYAAFNDRNRVILTAKPQIERERLQRDYDIAYETYKQIKTELEQARIRLNQEIPLFTQLESPIVPNGNVSPKTLQIYLYSIVATIILAGLGILISEYAIDRRDEKDTAGNQTLN